MDGVKDFFAHQPGVTKPLDLMPVVHGRFISINGKSLDEIKDQHYPKRMLEHAELTLGRCAPEGDK